MSNMNIWFILAQVFGIGAMIFEFVCYQVSQEYEKAKYFLLTGIGSAFWALMFVSMGIATGMSTQTSLIVAATYSTFRNLVFFGVFKKDTIASKKFGKKFLLVMLVVGLIAGYLSVSQVPDSVRLLHIFVMVTSLLFVVCQYLPGDHYVRISVALYAVAVLLTQTPLNILYGEFRWNIMGILIESSKIISVLVFYVLQIAKIKRARNLQFSKYIIAEELSKIEEIAGQFPIENIPAVSQIEKMMTKMVRTELKMVNSARMKDIASTKDELQIILDDLQMLQRLENICTVEAD